MTLNEFDLTPHAHQSLGHSVLAGGKLIADRADGERMHPMPLAHKVFNHTGVSPGEQGVDAPHFRVEPVVRFVADGDYGRDATRRVLDEVRKIPDSFIARDVFRILYPGIFPGL